MENLTLVVVGTKLSQKTQVITKRFEMDGVKYVSQKNEKDILKGQILNIKFSSMEKDIAKTRIIDIPIGNDTFFEKCIK